MKKLRIYNHLNELLEEHDIFVEGQDFKHEWVKPVPLWVGTLVIEDSEKPATVIEPKEVADEEVAPVQIEEPKSWSEPVRDEAIGKFKEIIEVGGEGEAIIKTGSSGGDEVDGHNDVLLTPIHKPKRSRRTIK